MESFKFYGPERPMIHCAKRSGKKKFVSLFSSFVSEPKPASTTRRQMDGGRKNTRGKKRSANDEPMEDVGESGGAKQRGKQLENENEMAFEDPFEDEYEDEDLEGEEEQDDGEDGGDGMDVDMDENENEETQVGEFCVALTDPCPFTDVVCQGMASRCEPIG
jgi:hypothetical protein